MTALSFDNVYHHHNGQTYLLAFLNKRLSLLAYKLSYRVSLGLVASAGLIRFLGNVTSRVAQID